MNDEERREAEERIAEKTKALLEEMNAKLDAGVLELYMKDLLRRMDRQEKAIEGLFECSEILKNRTDRLLGFEPIPPDKPKLELIPKENDS